MSEKNKEDGRQKVRADGRHCFVCGPDNPIGLRVSFRMHGDVCLGEFTPGPAHVGFDNVVHGGIIYSALDDVLGNWLFLQGARGYTARCEIRYRQILPVGVTVRLEGRLLRRKGRVLIMQARAARADNDETFAECEARFMLVEPGSIPD